MKIQITARHFKASSDLQTYAAQAVERLGGVYEGIVSADVILEERVRGGSDRVAEVKISVYREQLVAKEESNDIKHSIQSCVLKLERQLQRYKDKLHAGQRPHEGNGVIGSV